MDDEVLASLVHAVLVHVQQHLAPRSRRIVLALVDEEQVAAVVALLEEQFDSADLKALACLSYLLDRLELAEVEAVVVRLEAEVVRVAAVLHSLVEEHDERHLFCNEDLLELLDLRGE